MPVQNNNSVLNVKVLEEAFNQVKALVGASSLIVKLQSLPRIVSSSNWHPAVISSGALVCRHSSGHYDREG